MENELTPRFEKACQEAQNLRRKPDNDTLLKLYALYKQAVVGDASGRRPGFTDPVGRAKFNAWSKLSGVSKNDAKKKYIELVERLKKG